jgi:AraC family ethanolamine operon transcriptional activator
MTEYQEARLFNMVAQLVFHNSQHEVRIRPATSNALRVVETALEPFNDSQTTPTVADLCAASGVGVTWLHQCFHDIYGISPAQFILNKRLSVARERFLDFDCPPRSVKDVALSLGFVGPGRFAQYYRRAFGELPGETFRRAGHR